MFGVKRNFYKYIISPRYRLYKILFCVIIAGILNVVYSLIETIYTGDYSTTQFPLENYILEEYDDDIADKRHLRRDQTPDMKHDISDEKNLKYILMWSPQKNPFKLILGRGRVPFVKHKCKYTNCFLTHKRNLKNTSNFHAILFSIETLANYPLDLPEDRSPDQKFVAVSTKPPSTTDYLDPILDGYFNWTWTYKLDSDILWRNIQIVDKNGREIGPGKQMKWIEMTSNVPEKVEDILFEKSKTVVWLIRDCNFDIKIINYVQNLAYHLSEYKLDLDILGECSFATGCKYGNVCSNSIVKDYHFYIAFENIYHGDFVTKTLLIGIQHFAIPIVFGSKFYSRFLPPNSFLDADLHNPQSNANTIKNIVGDFSLLKSYFRWTNHYEYRSTKSEICNICTALNNKQMVEQVSIHNYFRKWWNKRVIEIYESGFDDIFRGNKDLLYAFNTGDLQLIRKFLKEKYFDSLSTEFVYTFDVKNANFTTTDDNYLGLNDTTTEIILVEDD